MIAKKLYSFSLIMNVRLDNNFNKLEPLPISIGNDLEIINQMIFAQAERSQAFFNVLRKYSDLVEPGSMSDAFIDLSQNSHQWISPEAAGKDVQQCIEKTMGIRCSVGIGNHKALSFIAANTGPLGSIVYISREQEQEFLNPLAISLIPGIGRRTEQVLRQAGINTIGQLSQIPEIKMREVFGNSGVVLSRLARGIEQNKIRTWKKSLWRTKPARFTLSKTKKFLLSTAGV